MIMDQAEELSVFRDHFDPDPDWKGLLALEEAGHFHVFTARCDGYLCGYIPFYLVHHPHYRTVKWATADNYYVEPAHRARAGLAMLRKAVEALRDLDVGVIAVHDKIHTDREHVGMGDLFARLGFEPIERLYAMVLK